MINKFKIHLGKSCHGLLLDRQYQEPRMCGAELFTAGRGGDKNPRGGPGRGGAKKRVNQLIWKFDKSAYIVTGGFVLQYGVLIKENITFSDF